MGDYFEDQQNELEALESIYSNELTIVSKEMPITMKVLISTQLENEQIADTSVTVSFCLPFNYPDVPPQIEILEPENLTDDEVDALYEKAKETADENIGSVMIYTLITSIQEKMVDMVEKGAEQLMRSEEEKKRLAEEAEAKRLEGTKVTVESFLKWKEKFEAELAELDGIKKKDVSSGDKKLTGKELFMRDHDMDDSDIRMLDDGSEVVEIDESLFEDFEELDVSDIEKED